MSFKIRPLAGVAIALTALGLAQVGRVALDASNAFAAGDAAKKEEPAGAAAPTADAKAGGAANVGPPMCLPVDLAKEAGISAAEFRLLQSLQERRQTLDAREREIVTRENVLKTAETRIQERTAALQTVETNIQKLLGQVDEAEAARLIALVAVYEKMKPKDAAAVWEGLDTEVLLKIAQRMKNQSLSLILAKMTPARAREVTTRLAQIDASSAFSEAAAAPAATPAPATVAPAAGATPAPKAATPKAPGQQAAATPTAAQSPAGAGPTAPKAPAPKAPSSPTAAQPTARPASGQAPADPAQSGRPADKAAAGKAK